MKLSYNVVIIILIHCQIDSESTQHSNIYTITLDTELVGSHDETDMPQANNDLSSLIYCEQTGHVYAVLEETQQLSAIPTDNERVDNNDIQSQISVASTAQEETLETLNQSRQQITNSCSVCQQQKETSQNLLSGGHFEFVQIYDNVSPETVVYANILHQRGPGRKHSLPASLVIPQKSSASSSNGSSGRSRVTDLVENKPEEPSPIYSVPDMKKKREGRLKNILEMEGEARRDALRKISSTSCPPLLLTKESSIAHETRRESDSQSPIYANHPKLSEIQEHNHKPSNEALAADDDAGLYEEPNVLNMFLKKTNISILEKELGEDYEKKE